MNSSQEEIETFWKDLGRVFFWFCDLDFLKKNRAEKSIKRNTTNIDQQKMRVIKNPKLLKTKKKLVEKGRKREEKERRLKLLLLL